MTGPRWERTTWRARERVKRGGNRRLSRCIVEVVGLGGGKVRTMTAIY
jgi:hypothetical protein